MKKQMLIIIGLLIAGIIILTTIYGYNFNKAYIHHVRTNTIEEKNYLDERFENFQ